MSFQLVIAGQKLDGFLALLSVTGGSWPAPVKKLPFSVMCVNGDSSLPYFASIDLVGSSSEAKSNKSPSKARFKVPVKGRVQLVKKLSQHIHSFWRSSNNLHVQSAFLKVCDQSATFFEFY